MGRSRKQNDEMEQKDLTEKKDRKGNIYTDDGWEEDIPDDDDAWAEYDDEEAIWGDEEDDEKDIWKKEDFDELLYQVYLDEAHAPVPSYFQYWGKKGTHFVPCVYFALLATMPLLEVAQRKLRYKGRDYGYGFRLVYIGEEVLPAPLAPGEEADPSPLRTGWVLEFVCSHKEDYFFGLPVTDPAYLWERVDRQCLELYGKDITTFLKRAVQKASKMAAKPPKDLFTL